MIQSLTVCERPYRTATKSGNSNCVKLRGCQCHGAEIRDSKAFAAGALTVSPAAFDRFIGAVADGRIAR